MLWSLTIFTQANQLSFIQLATILQERLQRFRRTDRHICARGVDEGLNEGL